MKNILLIHYGLKKAKKDGLFIFGGFKMTYEGATSVIKCENNKVMVDDIDFNSFPTIDAIEKLYAEIKEAYGANLLFFNRVIKRNLKRIDYILSQLKYI